jgi:hemolysin activation/secretion protein
MRRSDFWNRSRTLLCVTLLGAGSAGAQVPPAEAPAGAVPSIDELRRPPTPGHTDPGAMPASPVPLELEKPDDDITIDVEAYVLNPGAPEELKQALAALTAPYVGKARNYEDLMNAVSAVTLYLQRDMGYYLGQAYLPAQAPSDGVIRIEVLEGRLDEVILNWSDDIRLNRAVIEAHLAQLKPGSILRVRDVERVVFLINDLRGLTARFDIRQGRKPGTASLVVTPTAEGAITGKADLDGNGSRFSGVYRFGTTVTINSPFKRGDNILVGALGTDTDGLRFLLAGYTLPIGSDGLKAGISYSKVDYQLIDEVPLDLNGEARATSLYALYPLVRSRNLNVFLQASYERRDFVDRKGDLGPAADTRKRSDEWRLGIAGDFRDGYLGGGISSYEFAYILSRLDYLKNGPALSVLDPRERKRVVVGFSRLNKLVENRALLYMNVYAQRAWSNLDTTEQFSLGGAGRVRAFAPGEGTGDEGEFASLELRLIPPAQLLGRYARETMFTLFYDWGRVQFKHDPSRQPMGFIEEATFSGYGVGATWERPKSFSARISFAWPDQGVAQSDPQKREPRVYGTLTVPF